MKTVGYALNPFLVPAGAMPGVTRASSLPGGDSGALRVSLPLPDLLVPELAPDPYPPWEAACGQVSRASAAPFCDSGWNPQR